MYPWVDGMHTHLGGECGHGCIYCYVNSRRWGRPKRYIGEIRLIDKELEVDYGSGKTIFIEHMNDMFADRVPSKFIDQILEHCNKYPDNTYVFQSKNPARALEFVDKFPEKIMFGTTIETNRENIIRKVSKAPPPNARFTGIYALKHLKNLKTTRIFVTLEPIMDFDLEIMTSWLKCLKPDFVNIGADSQGHKLQEPSWSKVEKLIKNIQNANIEIREKSNLERLKR